MNMIAKRRGSSITSWPGRAIVAFMALSVVLLEAQYAQATTYTVGGINGWSHDAVVGWLDGKHFKANDILVFNYNPKYHNVVAVDKRGYEKCETPNGARTFTTGKDRIKLGKGRYYFICNFPGHCQTNLKIAVTAV